jgi:hypothetical protein
MLADEDLDEIKDRLKRNSSNLRMLSRKCYDIGLDRLFDDLCCRAWCEEDIIRMIEWRD